MRKASCRIILSTPGSFNVCKCLQCAKVPPMISVISVRERSTNCSCIHRSQAPGPIQLKSGGRVNAVKPASMKQHSGKHRRPAVRMVLRQLEIDLTQHCTFTKGSGHEFCLWSELIGGIMSSPNLQKRTALFKDLCSKLLASWCYDSAQCIAA